MGQSVEEKEWNANGHEYVDLGLPSGLLWATCNVGASRPEESGDYFAWGETQQKSNYDESTYKWYNSYGKTTKYITEDTKLQPEDDAARVYMGGDWRMPTFDELNELRTRCTWTRKTQNGVNGFKGVGPNGNTIFLPAAGYRSGSSLNEADSGGHYWSSSLYSVYSYNAYCLKFDSSNYDWNLVNRCYGQNVRGVIGKTRVPVPEPTTVPEPTGYSNNQAYVDLGLPSGTLWANCNVGARRPEDYGDYFAWGETKPKIIYSLSYYKWCKGEYNTMTKYCCIHSSDGYKGFTDSKTTLELSDDAAHVNMGGDWRMPTRKEQEELLNQCVWILATLGGINGYKVIGPNGNFIFLPAAGNQAHALDNNRAGSYGYYWSSSLRSSNNNTYYIHFDWSCYSLENANSLSRGSGWSVRGVLSSVVDNSNDSETETITETEPTGYNNGYAYIDLGLSSGTLWATCNVGASKPEEHGDYFAWGETQPKDEYNWITYKWSNGSENTMIKYCTDIGYGNNGFTDGKKVLDLSDDAARVNMGGDWRMPTKEDLQELIEECLWTWTSLGGKNGHKVVGPNGNFIFLPAVGCYHDRSLLNVCSKGEGYYWLSSLEANDSERAYIILFHSNFCSPIWCTRFVGHNVRGVLSSVIDKSNISETEIVIETEPTGYNNGHAYVDLGLPSGTLWANCNVGASSPEEYGDYFAWGETQPKESYDWSTYKWCNGDYNKMTKCCTNPIYGNNGLTDDKTTFELSDDAARANMGGDWRMPTKEEQDELRTKCIWMWVTICGKSGYKVIGPNGNFIFLPASGYKEGSKIYHSGAYGFYWSLSLSPSLNYYAYHIYFYLSSYYWDYIRRYCGLSVRGVLDPASK